MPDTGSQPTAAPEHAAPARRTTSAHAGPPHAGPARPPAPAQDPTVTRLIPRRLSSSAVTADAAESAVRTSVSAVLVDDADPVDRGARPAPRGSVPPGPVPPGSVPSPGPVASASSGLDALAAWRPDRLRLELLVVEERHHPARASVQERLAASGCSWRLIERPRGGRAAVIGVAAEQAEHEFLVVGGGTRAPLHLVTRALSFMWSEGGDAALVEDAAASTGDGPDPDASDDDVPGERAHGVGGAPAGDAAAELVAWLGLSEPLRPGRLVILRRWVARWLFNEVTRALSPADEVADRARLLGIGIVQLTEVEDADRPARPRGAGGGAPRAG